MSYSISIFFSLLNVLFTIWTTTMTTNSHDQFTSSPTLELTGSRRIYISSPGVLFSIFCIYFFAFSLSFKFFCFILIISFLDSILANYDRLLPLSLGWVFGVCFRIEFFLQSFLISPSQTSIYVMCPTDHDIWRLYPLRVMFSFTN